jgi:biotin carboxyl carrier protein
MSRLRFVGETRGRDYVIDVDNHGNDDGYYTMVLNGKSYEVDAQLMRSQIVSMLIDQRSYDVDIEKTGDPTDTLDGRMNVRVRGRVVNLEMLDERRRKMKEAASSHLGGDGALAVESPMPGKVINILVQVGDALERGEGVVVVEAMKMENELKTAKKGVVKSIDVKKGESVTAGQVLVVIE